MKILVDIAAKPEEWNDSLRCNPLKPRMPIPAAFGAAFKARGHRLSALNIYARKTTEDGNDVFDRIYGLDDTREALKNCDFGWMWGRFGVTGAMWSAIGRKPRFIVKSYVWPGSQFPSMKERILASATSTAAAIADGVLVMTREQSVAARDWLPKSRKVLYYKCGIDTQFYSRREESLNLPLEFAPVLTALFQEPYLIMPGDELRFNLESIEVARRSGLRVVRVFQYPGKSDNASFRQQIREASMEGRVLIFEKVTHSLLRLLLQNALAYIGLVDSTWQPAGWTVACEALAAGLECVIYDGIVARELRERGLVAPAIWVVPHRDVAGVIATVKIIAGCKGRGSQSEIAQKAAALLDIDEGARNLVAQVEGAFGV